MKKVEPLPEIETILPLKGAHRQVALEYIITCVKKSIADRDKILNIRLNEAEYMRVMKWVHNTLNKLEKEKHKIQYGKVGNSKEES